jgi:cytochrome c biogenesis protein CcmG/thiol:disulfide interchange protein DsbE
MKRSTVQADPRRAWMALAAAVCLAVLAGWLVVDGGIDRLRPRVGGQAGSVEAGQPAPAFCLESAAGGQECLGDYYGQVVLLNFWATWCVPCRAEMPEIESAYRAHRERGFQVLAINVQETEAEVRPFARELGLTFPAVLDRDAGVARAYLARALPSSFLVDRRGVLRYVRVGPLTSTMLEEQLGKLGL